VKLIFSRRAWDDYTGHTDRALIRRTNQLIDDIMRNGHDGIGKPEPLRGDLAGWWSRRINREHRLVYRLTDDGVEIAACRTHYGDR
jgi:toxin YoeB